MSTDATTDPGTEADADRQAVAAPPTIQVAKGNPSDEELAALVAVVQGLAAAQVKRPTPPELSVGGGWKSYWHIIRQPLNPGRETWRTTFRR